MVNANQLLDAIVARSQSGDLVAVARVMGNSREANFAASVYEDQILPPIADRKLKDQILSAVRRVIEDASLADVVECEDEKGSRVRVAIELIKPEHELLVFGAGHVGQAVALIAALTGYRVTVVDDRQEFASRQRFPDPRIELVASAFDCASDKLRITSGTAVVIVTRGHQFDELCLKNVIRSNATYIGMIGSRRRVLSVFKKLSGEGIADRELQRVHAPIGLRIGARSPQEIGVSIVAEIIDHLNNPHLGTKGK